MPLRSERRGASGGLAGSGSSSIVFFRIVPHPRGVACLPAFPLLQRLGRHVQIGHKAYPQGLHHVLRAVEACVPEVGHLGQLREQRHFLAAHDARGVHSAPTRCLLSISPLAVDCFLFRVRVAVRTKLRLGIAPSRAVNGFFPSSPSAPPVAARGIGLRVADLPWQKGTPGGRCTVDVRALHQERDPQPSAQL